MITPKELLIKTLNDLKAELDNNRSMQDALDDRIDDLEKEEKDLTESVRAYQKILDSWDEVTKPEAVAVEVKDGVVEPAK